MHSLAAQTQRSAASTHPDARATGLAARLINSSHQMTPRQRAGALAGLVLAAGAVAAAVAVPVTARQHGGTGGPAASPPPALRQGAASSSRSSRGSSEEASAGARTSPQACNGVPGLCQVPVRLVSFAGTHNSHAIKTTIALFENQKLSFKQQLQAGVRLFDVDLSSPQPKLQFAHCFGCFCSPAADAADADPAKVFATMAEFLTSSARDVIVIGLSNIQCGSKALVRQQLLEILAASPLAPFLATQVIQPDTTLGELVDSNQRAVLLFYDEWASAGGSKGWPAQPLFRVYGGNTSVDASGPAAIDRQVALRLSADVAGQFKSANPSPDIIFRVVGLFASTCIICRTGASGGQCGPSACAVKANSLQYIMYLLGSTTAAWLGGNSARQQQLVPAFNGWQVDHVHLPVSSRGPLAAAEQLNTAAAWMWQQRPAEAPLRGLANCVWVLDDASFAGGLACVHHGRLSIGPLLATGSGASSAGSAGSAGAGNLQPAAGGRRLAAAAASGHGAISMPGSGAVAQRRALLQQQSASRRLLVPANAWLQVLLYAGNGQPMQQLAGMASSVQVLRLSSSATALEVLWQ